MQLPDRHLLLGMSLGAFTATALAAIGPGAVFSAVADEFLPTGIDPDSLVRFEDRLFDVQHEDWVSTDPLSTARVKKVEAGKVSYVTITTTATGAYSTDAMFSRHVKYPGISVEEVTPRPRFSTWSDGHWFAIHVPVANSFFYYEAGDISLADWGSDACVSGANFIIC